MLRAILNPVVRIGLIFALVAITLGSHAADISLVPSARYALAPPATRYTVEATGIDREAEWAADAQRPKFAPLRYAASRTIAHVARTSARDEGGEWRELPDGMSLWRIPLRAPRAASLDFVFRKFFLPPGAQ